MSVRNLFSYWAFGPLSTCCHNQWPFPSWCHGGCLSLWRESYLCQEESMTEFLLGMRKETEGLREWPGGDVFIMQDLCRALLSVGGGGFDHHLAASWNTFLCQLKSLSVMSPYLCNGDWAFLFKTSSVVGMWGFLQLFCGSIVIIMEIIIKMFISSL